MRRIIVDCTHTFHTGAGTGIQRVVRQYADALLEIGPASGVEVIPARVQGAMFVPLPVEGSRVMFPRAASAREAEASASAGILARLAAPAIRALMRSRSMAAWLDPGPNADRRRRRAVASPASGALALSRDDVVLCLDSSWVYDVRSALDAAGASGALRAAMICDVLPLTHPEWFTEGTRRYFGSWLRAILPRLEGVVTISDATQHELRALQAAGKLGLAPLPAMQTVHLGAEIVAPAASVVRPELVASFQSSRGPAFLTVGTVEPRKNLDYALDLFDALLERGCPVQWHIAGAAGWLAEKTARRIRLHPQRGYGLFWWADLNDAELAECYRRAAALVAVSRAEGFGLPLVEARLHGLPVFASDIPVFREVLGSEAVYLPLDAPSLAASILEDFLAQGRAVPRRDRSSAVARSWRESATDLVAALGRLHAR
jgi:glycosyltransferase involved in cell wall biosynthesis